MWMRSLTRDPHKKEIRMMWMRSLTRDPDKKRAMIWMRSLLRDQVKKKSHDPNLDEKPYP